MRLPAGSGRRPLIPKLLTCALRWTCRLLGSWAFGAPTGFRVPMTAVGLAIQLTMRSTSNICLIGLALASLGVPIASRILLALRLIIVGLASGPSSDAYVRASNEHNKTGDSCKVAPHTNKLQGDDIIAAFRHTHAAALGRNRRCDRWTRGQSVRGFF